MRSRSRVPSWMSSAMAPRPTPLSRDSTASIAARFSATNSTLRPRATSAAIMFAIVWLLPVPGGPWITRLRPASTVPIALRCEESASSTEKSASGASRSGSASASSGSASPVLISSCAAGSPAIAATMSLSPSSSPAACRSRTIGSLAYVNVPMTCRSAIRNPGTSAACAAAVSSAPTFSGGSSASCSVAAPNTAPSLCSSTGLTSVSSSVSSKSSCRALVGVMVRPRSSTGAAGSRNSSSQLASPVAR